MQLKRDDNNDNTSPQQGGVANSANDYYSNQTGQSSFGGPGESPYGGPSQSPYGGPSQSPYGGPSQSYNGGAGQSPYGAPNESPYGTPGQSSFGQPSFGQSSYGGPADPYGAPNNYNAPAGQGSYIPPTVKNKGGMPGWVIGVIVLAIICVAGFLLLGTDLFGKRFTVGKLSGNTFKNDYFGVEIRGGSDCVMTGYAGSESSEKEALKTNYNAVNELTMTTNQGEVLIFSVLNCGRDVKGSGYSDKEIMDEMEATFKSTIESSGYSGVEVEQQTLSICGTTRYGFRIKAGTGYGNVYCDQYYVFYGKYVGIFTAVATSKTKAASLITEYVKKCSPE